MSRRGKPSERAVPRLTPAAAASDLIRIAIATQGMPDMEPVRILADDTTRELTRVEAARAMLMLAVIARTFALSLPAETRAAILLRMEDVMVNKTLVHHELDLMEQPAVS
jgi:hypothetical protein